MQQVTLCVLCITILMVNEPYCTERCYTHFFDIDMQDKSYKVLRTLGGIAFGLQSHHNADLNGQKELCLLVCSATMTYRLVTVFRFMGTRTANFVEAIASSRRISRRLSMQRKLHKMPPLGTHAITETSGIQLLFTRFENIRNGNAIWEHLDVKSIWDTSGDTMLSVSCRICTAEVPSSCG